MYALYMGGTYLHVVKDHERIMENIVLAKKKKKKKLFDYLFNFIIK